MTPPNVSVINTYTFGKNPNSKFSQLINGDARISRADISAVLGENDDPNFWPSRGRRNSLEPKFKQYLESKYNMNTLNGKTNMQYNIRVY